MFLDELQPLDRHFGLLSPREGGVEIRTAAKQRTGLGLYK
jgi:hypothetical protein